VQNSPFISAWTMEKDYCLMLLLLPRGLRLIFGYRVNVCIYLPSFTHCGLHGHCLVQKKISCNLSACPFVLHFHLVFERSAFFNDNAFLNFCLNSLHFLVDFLCVCVKILAFSGELPLRLCKKSLHFLVNFLCVCVKILAFSGELPLRLCKKSLHFLVNFLCVSVKILALSGGLPLRFV
jgi:hypothetical protein